MVFGKVIGTLKLESINIMEIQGIPLITKESDGRRFLEIYRPLVDMIHFLTLHATNLDLFSINQQDWLMHQMIILKDMVIKVVIVGPGDIIGMAINLPRMPRVPPQEGTDFGVDIELLTRLWDPDTMTQYNPFPIKPFETVPGSTIEYFKNGVSMGIAFENLNHGIFILRLGKYHPCISLYNGASITVNFGPDFLFNPPKGAKGFFAAEDLPQWGPALEAYREEQNPGQALLKKQHTDADDMMSPRSPSPSNEGIHDLDIRTPSHATLHQMHAQEQSSRLDLAEPRIGTCNLAQTKMVNHTGVVYTAGLESAINVQDIVPGHSDSFRNS